MLKRDEIQCFNTMFQHRKAEFTQEQETYDEEVTAPLGEGLQKR